MDNSRNRVGESFRAREGWLALWAECMSGEWRTELAPGGRGERRGGGSGGVDAALSASPSQECASAAALFGQAN